MAVNTTASNHHIMTTEAVSRICHTRGRSEFDFIFTIDDESKGLNMKGDSEFGLALGVGALSKAAIAAILNVGNAY